MQCSLSSPTRRMLAFQCMYGMEKMLCPSAPEKATDTNLELLSFHAPLRALKHSNGDYGDIGLEYLPSLRELTGWFNCDGVSAAEGDAARWLRCIKRTLFLARSQNSVSYGAL